jgi:hypothetical protein
VQRRRSGTRRVWWVFRRAVVKRVLIGLQDEQARGVDDVLADADGFINSAKPDAYEACEEALSRTVRQIRSVAHQWKVRPGLLVSLANTD